MFKKLITGGCSCSFVNSGYRHRTWPVFLAEQLGLEDHHTSSAMVAQGNGMISRGVLHDIAEALKTHQPEELLVGISWSGPNRHEFFASTVPERLNKKDGWWVNPVKFNKNGWGSWALLNPHWDNILCETFYKNFHDDAGSAILTCEHVLRTQWFLQLHKIPYFMFNFTQEVFADRFRDHEDVKPLLEQIDFTKFLPVNGIYEWARDCTDTDFDADDICHPTSVQNQEFVDKIVMPFLTDHKYV